LQYNIAADNHRERIMKERVISAFLIVSLMCVALRGSGTTSTYLRSQHRHLRADNLTMSDGQENGTIASSIPLEEITMMEQVDNGTDMLEGDKEVELPPNPPNASNATLLVDSPPHADDDVNVTDDNMTNWMIPVTLNSSLPIEETSMIEMNNTSTDELLDVSNSTNNTSSLTVTPSTLASPQLNESTFEEEESSMNNNVTDTANATNATAIPDPVLATFNATTSAPTTTPLSSAPTTTVAQTIFNSPAVNPTPSNSFNTTITSVPPTSTPTIAVQTLNHTANPTIRFDSAATSAPPTIAPMTRSPTVNPTQKSEVPTLPNLDLDNATSSNSTSLMTSSEPTSRPTQDYDDDNDYNYDDDDRPWTYDGEPANISSPTPTPLPTYSPTTTIEANDTIYQIYYPTDFEEEEVPTDSPSDSPTTHYPTYSPTTTRKGERVRKRREKRKKNQRTAPTGSPTVVTKEFLEDVSASKTVGLVIVIILTILGIGCCAWCV
jgi:hypothetical protein